MTHDAITDETIRALRDEAGDAGDTELVSICGRALRGDEAARAECAEVGKAAQDMMDDDQ